MFSSGVVLHRWLSTSLLSPPFSASSRSTSDAFYAFPVHRALQWIDKGESFRRASLAERSHRAKAVWRPPAASLRKTGTETSKSHVVCEQSNASGHAEEEQQKAASFIKYHSHHLLMEWKRWSRRQQGSSVSSESTVGTASTFLFHAAALLYAGGLYEVGETHLERLLDIHLSSSIFLSKHMGRELPSSPSSSSAVRPSEGFFTAESWHAVAAALTFYCRAMDMWELQYHDDSELFVHSGRRTTDARLGALTTPFFQIFRSAASNFRICLQKTGYNSLYRHTHHSLLQYTVGSASLRREHAMQWFGFDLHENAVNTKDACEETRAGKAGGALSAQLAYAQQRQLQILPLFWLSVLMVTLYQTEQALPTEECVLRWSAVRQNYREMVPLFTTSVGVEDLMLSALQIAMNTAELRETAQKEASTAASGVGCTPQSPTALDLMRTVTLMEKNSLLPIRPTSLRRAESLHEAWREPAPLVMQYVWYWLQRWERMVKRLTSQRATHEEESPASGCGLETASTAWQWSEVFVGVSSSGAPVLRRSTTSSLHAYRILQSIPLSFLAMWPEDEGALGGRQASAPCPSSTRSSSGLSLGSSTSSPSHRRESRFFLQIHMVHLCLLSCLLSWRAPSAASEIAMNHKGSGAAAEAVKCFTHSLELYREESLSILEAAGHLCELWNQMRGVENDWAPSSLSTNGWGTAETLRRVRQDVLELNEETRAVLQSAMRVLAMQLGGLVALYKGKMRSTNEWDQCDWALLPHFHELLKEVLVGGEEGSQAEGKLQSAELLQLPLLYIQEVGPFLE